MSQPVGRVLVVGATGSIGRLVVARLLELGDQPRALTRDSGRARRLLDPAVDIAVGDLSDPELVESFDNWAFDEVLQHAGDLDTRTQLLVQLASMIASQAVAEYGSAARTGW